MVTRAGHHRAHMCVKVGAGAWSIGPWSACGGCASRAPMTRRHVMATGGFQRGGVLADGHPSRGATHRASHEHGRHRFTWRSTSTDGFRKTRVTHRRPRPSHWSGRAETRRHSLGVGRVSTGLSYSSAYDKPEQVIRTDGHDGDRPSVADADEHPCQTPNRSVSPASPLRGGQAARLPAPGADTSPLPRRSIRPRNNAADLRECRRRHRHHVRHAVLASRTDCRSPTLCVHCHCRLLPTAADLRTSVLRVPPSQVVKRAHCCGFCDFHGTAISQLSTRRRRYASMR